MNAGKYPLSSYPPTLFFLAIPTFMSLFSSGCQRWNMSQSLTWEKCNRTTWKEYRGGEIEIELESEGGRFLWLTRIDGKENRNMPFSSLCFSILFLSIPKNAIFNSPENKWARPNAAIRPRRHFERWMPIAHPINCIEFWSNWPVFLPYALQSRVSTKQ